VFVVVVVVGSAGFEAGGKPAAVSGDENRLDPKTGKGSSVWLLPLDVYMFSHETMHHRRILSFITFPF